MPATESPGPAAVLPPAPRHLVEQTERAIDRADTKATALGAAAIAVLTLPAPASAPAPGSPTSAAALIAAVRVAGLLGWTAGVLALCAALLPRLHRATPGENAVSFCDLSEEHDPERLRRLVGGAAGNAEDWLLAQALVLSRIAIAKYRFIRLGMALLAFSGLMGALALLLP